MLCERESLDCVVFVLWEEVGGGAISFLPFIEHFSQLPYYVYFLLHNEVAQ